MRFMRMWVAGCAILAVQAAAAVVTAEYRPVAVTYASETVSPNEPVARLIDGDPSTAVSWADDTRDGRDPATEPKFAAAPVTCSFVLDLGGEKDISGLCFTSCEASAPMGPERVSVWKASDAAGTRDLVRLAERVKLPPVQNGYPAYVGWTRIKARHLVVRVDESYARPITTGWFNTIQWEWNRLAGDAVSGDGKRHYCRLAEVSAIDGTPDPYAPNRPDEAYPEERLLRDWIYQDFGVKEGPARYAALPEEEKAAYRAKCLARRKTRLAWLRGKAARYVYVKHHVFGGEQGLVCAYDQRDDQVKTECGNRTGFSDNRRDSADGMPLSEKGGELCMLTIREDGTLAHEVLLDRPEGIITHPDLSWDGKTLVFALRENFDRDDVSLYTMDLATRALTRITFPQKDAAGRDLPVTDTEPVWLPNGDIVFTSTRYSRICDCWYRAGGDIYRCRADGSFLRRLTNDELMSNLPQVTADGRVVFTRWEYNDRTALYLHPLIVMNPDGTGQTEWYGNNSDFPSSILHAHAVPGSRKLLGLVAGHHAPYKGKLALIDRAEGTQAGEGIEFVAGSAPDRTPGRHRQTIKPRRFNDFRIDIFGQDGPQWCSCFAFDETHYLVSHQPEGCNFLYGPYWPRFGAYFQTADGGRELLAYDWKRHVGGIVPVMPRRVPPVPVDRVKPEENEGVFYVQDVYRGPGLAGVPRGTVKRLRVMALEYRTARVGWCGNGGEYETGLNQTPIALNSGAWDVKHVLGEVDVEADGSCAFKVPARQAVFFHLLDAEGKTVQMMRSWATLQPGEYFGCTGCHEPKRDAPPPEARNATIASRKPPQELKPFANGTREHPLVARLKQTKWFGDVYGFLGVNAPRAVDPEAPVEGFSYRREIQPILDRHCTRCHNASHGTLDLSGSVFPHEKVKRINRNYYNPKRAWTTSYVNLTAHGNPDACPWMKWLKPRSRTTMLPPYHTGSARSPIFERFGGAHHGVKLSDHEKRVFACWIDLLCPFAGSYAEANTWTDQEKETFLHFQGKRVTYAEKERADLVASLPADPPGISRPAPSPQPSRTPKPPQEPENARTFSLDLSAVLEAMPLFLRAFDIDAKARSREKAHAEALARRGIAEVPPSKAGARYTINTAGLGRFLFRDDGELWIDRRFVTAEEMKIVQAIERWIAKYFPGKMSPRVREAPKTGARLPVFRGFEDDRYQQYDALILELTRAFNADKAGWSGGTPAQAAAIAALDPAIVKAQMIEESGGNDARSRAAWAVDPLQVNVPGDWGEEKRLVGLEKPSKRNEGRAADNVRAAIKYLVRKGFATSARPAAERPKGRFDGWGEALRRYNGRRDRTETNRYYSDEYAAKILRRAKNPDVFVPIEIKLAK